MLLLQPELLGWPTRGSRTHSKLFEVSHVAGPYIKEVMMHVLSTVLGAAGQDKQRSKDHLSTATTSVR